MIETVTILVVDDLFRVIINDFQEGVIIRGIETCRGDVIIQETIQVTEITQEIVIVQEIDHITDLTLEIGRTDQVLVMNVVTMGEVTQGTGTKDEISRADGTSRVDGTIHGDGNNHVDGINHVDEVTHVAGAILMVEVILVIEIMKRVFGEEI